MTELMPSLCNDCVARNQCGKDDVKMCISYTKEIKIKCDDCKFVEDCVDYGWDGCKKFTPAPSTPMTNEEWIKSLDTEGLVDYLYEVHKGGNSVERQRWIERHKEQVKMQFRGWLKQPHSEVAE